MFLPLKHIRIWIMVVVAPLSKFTEKKKHHWLICIIWVHFMACLGKKISFLFMNNWAVFVSNMLGKRWFAFCLRSYLHLSSHLSFFCSPVSLAITAWTEYCSEESVSPVNATAMHLSVMLMVFALWVWDLMCPFPTLKPWLYSEVIF